MPHKQSYMRSSNTSQDCIKNATGGILEVLYAKKIASAKKYKIDPEPYVTVEFIHPRSGKHEFVEFHADGKLEGMGWVEPEYKPASSWKFFLAGMLWSGALASLLWVIVR